MLNRRSSCFAGQFLFGFVIAVFWGGGVGRAEIIHLKNGDRLSGKILHANDDTITLETRAMGQVTIGREFIEPVASAHENEVPEDRVDSKWDGTMSVGYGQSGGNTRQGEGHGEMSIKRKTETNETDFKWNAYYSSSNNRMDSQKFYGMGRHAYSFGQKLKWYHFFKIEGDRDRFSNIDHRLIPSTGAGYWFADSETFKLMSELAVGWQYTNFRDQTKSAGETVLIPRGYFEKTFWRRFRFSEDVTLYPSLEDPESFRLRSETALRLAMDDHLSWKWSLNDEFNSSPAGTAEKNDYTLTTSLEYAF